MDELQATSKLIMALIDQKDVVTSEYIDEWLRKDINEVCAFRVFA
jgi:hypothetical protein